MQFSVCSLMLMGGPTGLNTLNYTSEVMVRIFKTKGLWDLFYYPYFLLSLNRKVLMQKSPKPLVCLLVSGNIHAS